MGAGKRHNAQSTLPILKTVHNFSRVPTVANFSF
jgi:hypothetical protein